MSVECHRCGACCVAPDIAALDKPLGVPCVHLGADCLCQNYQHRPAACRAYRADELCGLIDAPTLAERVVKYLGVFRLEDEAAEVRRSGATSLKAWRASRRPRAPNRLSDRREAGETEASRARERRAPELCCWAQRGAQE